MAESQSQGAVGGAGGAGGGAASVFGGGLADGSPAAAAAADGANVKIKKQPVKSATSDEALRPEKKIIKSYVEKYHNDKTAWKNDGLVRYEHSCRSDVWPKFWRFAVSEDKKLDASTCAFWMVACKACEKAYELAKDKSTKSMGDHVKLHCAENKESLKTKLLETAMKEEASQASRSGGSQQSMMQSFAGPKSDLVDVLIARFFADHRLAKSIVESDSWRFLMRTCDVRYREMTVDRLRIVEQSQEAKMMARYLTKCRSRIFLSSTLDLWEGPGGVYYLIITLRGINDLFELVDFELPMQPVTTGHTATEIVAAIHASRARYQGGTCRRRGCEDQSATWRPRLGSPLGASCTTRGSNQELG